MSAETPTSPWPSAAAPTSPRPSAAAPKSQRPSAAAPSPPRLSADTEQSTLTVETFPLSKKLTPTQRMALLGSRGLNQASAEQLCNTVKVEMVDGTSSNFWALAPNGKSLGNMVNCVNWVAIAADAHHDEAADQGCNSPRGLAFVQWADHNTRVASTFVDHPKTWFVDNLGKRVSTKTALKWVRAAVGSGNQRARVHQLVLLGGAGAGAVLLRAIATASEASDDDLLYVSAAHMPTARTHLWDHVYVNRFGFTRVPYLRANLDDPQDSEEAHEVPLVVKVGDLRALYVAPS